MRAARQATCHPERKHHARGLCEPCYKIRQHEEKRESILAKQRARYKANPRPYDGTEARYHRHLKEKFGITPEEYQALLTKQSHVCAICKHPNQHFKRLHADHDHITGRLRGLLCNHCNTALGLIREDPFIAEAIARYIRENCIL